MINIIPYPPHSVSPIIVFLCYWELHAIFHVHFLSLWDFDLWFSIQNSITDVLKSLSSLQSIFSEVDWPWRISNFLHRTIPFITHNGTYGMWWTGVIYVHIEGNWDLKTIILAVALFRQTCYKRIDLEAQIYALFPVLMSDICRIWTLTKTWIRGVIPSYVAQG